MGSWLDLSHIIAFILGVLLSATVKGLASKVKGA